MVLVNLWDVHLKLIISFLLGIPLVLEITQLTQTPRYDNKHEPSGICNELQVLYIGLSFQGLG